MGEGRIYLRMVLFEKKATYTPEGAKQENYIKESQELPIGSLRFVAEVPVGTAVLDLNGALEDRAEKAAVFLFNFLFAAYFENDVVAAGKNLLG